MRGRVPVPLFAAYRRNENGTVTIFIVVMFTFLLTFTGLIFDVGRVFNIHSQAQAYVDDVALAAAAELDGQSGALQRAVRAALGDTQHGALLEPGVRLSLSVDKVVNVQSLSFLQTLAADPMPGTRSPVAGDVVLCTLEAGQTYASSPCNNAAFDALAQYVLVTATTETENYILFPIASAFVPDVQQQATVNPQAIAGFTGEICNFPPVLICNPYESTAPPYGGKFAPVLGQQILMKMQGAGAAWAPGNFGLVQAPSTAGGSVCNNNSGANFVRCILASVNPNTQCIEATVDVQPGQASGPTQDGLNVRFDMYSPPLSSNTAAFAPAANVTKGRLINCNNNQLSSPPSDASHTVPLPRDSCFQDASTCTGTVTCSGGRFGNVVTTAQLQTYWTANHGGTLPADLTTRYDVYRYEIDHNLVPNKSGFNPQGENGNPTCSSAPPIASATNDRRVFITAVINCLEHNVHGNQTDIPVAAFAKMFMTEPEGLCESGEFYAEMLGVVEPGDTSGVLHEFPVLYR